MAKRSFITLKITPRGLAPAQTADLKWDVEGTGAISLNGQAVTGHGSQPFTPKQAGTYTLTVMMSDDTAQDIRIAVSVEKQGPGPTRPPTVILTADEHRPVCAPSPGRRTITAAACTSPSTCAMRASPGPGERLLSASTSSGP